MTGKELAEEVLLRMGDPAGLEIPYPIIYRLATRAEAKIAKKTLCLRKVFSAAIVDSQVEYQLPTDFFHEFSLIVVSASGSAVRKLDPISRERAVSTTTIPSLEALHYFIDVSSTDDKKQSIYLWPALMTDDGSTLELQYAAVPVNDVGSGALTVHPVFHDAIMLETLANCALLPGSKVKDEAVLYRQMAEAELIEAKAAHSLRSGKPGGTTPFEPWRR